MDNGLTLELATELDREIKRQIEESSEKQPSALQTAIVVSGINSSIFENGRQQINKEVIRADALKIAAHACRLLQSL